MTTSTNQSDKQAAFQGIAEVLAMTIRIESVSAMSAFVQAAELRSFKLAGQQFGLSSSAIGKIIAKLEDQLSVRLFHRSNLCVSIEDNKITIARGCCAASVGETNYPRVFPWGFERPKDP